MINSFDYAASTASGTACANCTVEVFSDEEDEGRWYEGRTVADSNGDWSLNKGSAFMVSRLTATATDADGNTSEFSEATEPNETPGGDKQIYLPLVCRDEPPVLIPTPTLTPGTVTPAPTKTQTPTPSPTSPSSGLVPEEGHYTGSSPTVYFDVTSDPQVCDFYIKVPFGVGSCGITLGCTDITEGDFVYASAEMGARFTITGTFTTQTSAIGGYSVSMCENSFVFPASKGDWEANK